jgi:hypothetical protein
VNGLDHQSPPFDKLASTHRELCSCSYMYANIERVVPLSHAASTLPYIRRHIYSLRLYKIRDTHHTPNIAIKQHPPDSPIPQNNHPHDSVPNVSALIQKRSSIAFPISRKPAFCFPTTWDLRNCRSGPRPDPTTNKTTDTAFAVARTYAACGCA